MTSLKQQQQKFRILQSLRMLKMSTLSFKTKPWTQRKRQLYIPGLKMLINRHSKLSAKRALSASHWLLHCTSSNINKQGRLHKGRMVRDAPWRKLVGNRVMIIMLLLVSIIIYYYMNTFITLHQCTFNLLFVLFLHCVSKTSPMFLAITRKSIVGFS